MADTNAQAVMSSAPKRLLRYAGWAGTLLLALTFAELAIPFARAKPVFIFGSLLVSLVLCASAGLFYKRWFLLPSLIIIGLIVLLLVSVFAE